MRDLSDLTTFSRHLFPHLENGGIRTRILSSVNKEYLWLNNETGNLSGLTSYTPNSVPATLTSLLVLRHTSGPASGPFHWPFLLPTTLYPWSLHGSFWGSVQMAPSPWPSELVHLAGLRPLLCFLSPFALYDCQSHSIVCQFIVLSFPVRSPVRAYSFCLLSHCWVSST